jgi:iron complex outermembrane receptor protein
MRNTEKRMEKIRNTFGRGARFAAVRWGLMGMSVRFAAGAWAQAPAGVAGEVLGDTLSPRVLLGAAEVHGTVTADARAPFAATTLAPAALRALDAGVDLPYLLRFTPSMVVTSDAGTGIGYTGMRIRGSDATRINVTLNGVPINDAESHQVYWVNMPDVGSSLDGLQIQRGAGTSTNGPGAFGATVALSTLGMAGEPGGRAVLGGGAFGTLRTTLQWSSGRLGDGWAMEGRATRVQSAGFVDRASSALGSVHWALGKFWKKGRLVYTLLDGHERTYQAWYGVPRIALTGDAEAITAWAQGSYEYGYGSDTERIADLIARGPRHNYYRYANEVDDYAQTHHQLLLHQRWGGWETSLTANWTRGGGFYEQFRAGDDLDRYGFATPEATGDVVRRRWLRNDLWGVHGFAERTFAEGSVGLGGSAFRYVGDHFGEVVWALPSGALEAGDGVSPGDRYYEGQGVKDDANAFARVVYQPGQGRIRVHGEGQIRQVTYRADGRDNDLRVVDVDDDLVFFNPKLGADWLFGASERGRVFASLAVANREPSRTDYLDGPGGAQTRPERLRDVELGVQWTLGPGNAPRGRVEAVLYHMHYRDQLVLTGELNDVGNPIRTNVPESYRRGLELSAVLRLDPAGRLTWSPQLAGSQNRIPLFEEVLYDYGTPSGFDAVRIPHADRDIAFSPRLVASSSLLWNLHTNRSTGSRWEAEWLWRRVGRQFLDNTASPDRALDAYTVHDLRLRRTQSSRSGESLAHFSVFVNNLANRLYSTNGWTYSYQLGGASTRVDEVYLFPQAGRHLMCSVELVF